MTNINKEKIIYNLKEEGKIIGYKYSFPKETYKGIVIIVHGMAEHIDRYENFINHLAEDGYVVYGYNQRGHKDTIKNNDDYGYMSDNDNFEILVDDLHEVVQKAKTEYNLPVYVFGHSMGSFVTNRYIEEYNEVNGVILCGSSKNPNLMLKCGIFFAKMINAFKGRRYRSNFLNSLTFGSYNKSFKPNRTEYDWLNRDESEVDKYVNDSYCGGIFTAAYFKDFLKGLLNITKNVKNINKDLPIYIISGSKDPVGSMGKGVNALYNSLKKQNVNNLKLKLYEGARHEILLETCKEEVINDVISWLNNN